MKASSSAGLRLSLLLYLCLYLRVSFAQQIEGQDIWLNGELFLVDSTTKIGKIKYDFGSNTVVLKTNGRVALFNPSQFFKVTFSTEESLTRELVIKSKKNSKGFHVAQLFEVLVDESTKLLVREEVVYYSTGSMATQGFKSEIVPLLVYNYYVQILEGEVISFNNNRRNVMKIMKSDSELIKTYVKENKLRYSQKKDLIQIFKYYNTLLLK